jgi:hypothetical protein
VHSVLAPVRPHSCSVVLDHEIYLLLRDAKGSIKGHIKIQLSTQSKAAMTNFAMTGDASSSSDYPSEIQPINLALKDRAAVEKVIFFFRFLKFSDVRTDVCHHQLQSLGFSHEVAFRAYIVCHCDVDVAANGLLEGVFY